MTHMGGCAAMRLNERWGGLGARVAGGRAEAGRISMTQRVESFVPTVVSATTFASPPAVAAPAQREHTQTGGLPRWLCLVIADAVAVTGSAIVLGLLAPGEWAATRPAVVAVMVLAFLTALALSGSYGRYAAGLISSGRLGAAGVWRAVPLGVVLASWPGGGSAERRRRAQIRAGRAGSVAWTGRNPGNAPCRACAGHASATDTARLILGTGRVAARMAGRLRRCSDVLVVGVVDDDPRMRRLFWARGRVAGALCAVPDRCCGRRVLA